MLTHAFQFVDSVLFIIGSENTRSQKAVEKIGAEYKEARDDNNVVFELTCENFQADFGGQKICR